jgi:hypothetical protein
MKKKMYLWGLILLFSFEACQTDQSNSLPNTEQELKLKLVQDHNFLELCDVNKQLHRKMSSDYFGFSGRDKQFIQQNEANLIDPKQAKIIYEKAKMKNVDEYILLTGKERDLIQIAFKKYPKMKEDINLYVKFLREISENRSINQNQN